MPLVEIDFETFKEITRRRPSEAVSEGDVIRQALGLTAFSSTDDIAFWESEGVKFPVGAILEHKFRDGRIVKAEVTATGLMVDGQRCAGLLPAAVAITHHQVNGWLFWYARDRDGRLVAASTLRPQRSGA